MVLGWLQLDPQVSTPGPTARYGRSMAFTAGSTKGGEILLFGGTDGTSIFGDELIFAAPNATTSILGTAYLGTPYDYTIPVVGGVGPYTFTQDGFPYTFASFGLNLNPNTGEITGTNTAVSGQLPIGVTITDSQGLTTDIAFTLPVDSPITLSPTSLPAATAGTNYLVQLGATGGTAPYTFSATGLPAGISLNSSNQLVGMCTASSTNVMITVTDSQTPSPASAASGPLVLQCDPATAQITIATNPVGLRVSVDGGTLVAAPLIENWTAGSSHTIATTSPQSGGAGVQYVFNNWSDSGAISHSIAVPSTATTYTASFNPQYQLTTQALPSGGGSVTPTSGSYYASGTAIPVTATANSGSVFSNWTSTGGTFDSPTATGTNFHMPSAPATATGNFLKTQTITFIRFQRKNKEPLST